MTVDLRPGRPPRASRLDQVLHRVRMRGDFYCQAELSDDWALEMPEIADSVSFHVVTQGSCTLDLPGHSAVELSPGDIALVPHGRGHVLRSATASVEPGRERPRPERVDHLPQDYLGPSHSRLVHGGGGGITSRLLCGIVSFEEPAARELARHLPHLVVITPKAVTGHSRIMDSVRAMGDELAWQTLGGDVVASRLADIIVVQAIRIWLAEHTAESSNGWFAAVEDERLGPALMAIHREPARAWTLTDLARLATMSRSLFSARFAKVVGETPVAYATRWRLEAAQPALLDERQTISQVAASSGYSSEAAFTRAFVRVFGTTPGRWRRDRIP